MHLFVRIGKDFEGVRKEACAGKSHPGIGALGWSCKLA